MSEENEINEAFENDTPEWEEAIRLVEEREKEDAERERLEKEELDRKEALEREHINADRNEEKRLEEEARKAEEEAKKAQEEAKRLEEEKKAEEAKKEEERLALEREAELKKAKEEAEADGLLEPHYVNPKGYDPYDGRRIRNLPHYLDNAQSLEFPFPNYSSTFKPKTIEDFGIKDFSPNIEDIVSKYDKDLDKLLNDFSDLEAEIPETDYMPDSLVTDTTINGYGFYDIIAQSYINKLDHVRSLCGIDNKEFFDYIARTLPTFAQVACTYALGKEQNRLQAKQIEAQNLAVKAQILETKSRAMLIKAQLESVGYDNAIKEQQAIAAYYEVQKAKAELPSIFMNQELIHENILATRNATQKGLLEHELIKRQILSEMAVIQDVVDGKPVEGKVGAEKRLAETQSLSYERDSHIRFMELFFTAWQTKKAGDNAILSPTVFSSLVIDKLAKSVGVKLFDFDPKDLDIPENWKEYMDEEELSGKKSPSQFVTK